MTIKRIIVEIDDNPNEEEYIVEIDGSDESLSLFETAPQEDWVPACFSEDDSGGWCYGQLWTPNGYELNPSCGACPYRKVRKC